MKTGILLMLHLGPMSSRGVASESMFPGGLLCNEAKSLIECRGDFNKEISSGCKSVSAISISILILRSCGRIAGFKCIKMMCCFLDILKFIKKSTT